MDLSNKTPAELRAMFRTGELCIPTAGLCPGHLQGNLVILHRKYADDFLTFMKQNPKPCPILEVFDQGTPISRKMAPGADITTDIPLYRIYRDGVMTDELKDVSEYWTPDMMGFLIGCSLTFEDKLVAAAVQKINGLRWGLLCFDPDISQQKDCKQQVKKKTEIKEGHAGYDTGTPDMIKNLQAKGDEIDIQDDQKI